MCEREKTLSSRAVVLVSAPHLFSYFMSCQVAAPSAVACCAKCAAHRAANLAGDAGCQPARVLGNADSLNDPIISQPQQEFACSIFGLHDVMNGGPPCSKALLRKVCPQSSWKLQRKDRHVSKLSGRMLECSPKCRLSGRMLTKIGIRVCDSVRDLAWPVRGWQKIAERWWS
jgi:hypothetical protein